jgi:Ca-activated chloride channel family protein
MSAEKAQREIHPHDNYRLERLMALITVLLFVLTFSAWAQPLPEQKLPADQTVGLDEIGEGSLLLNGGRPGRFIAAPMVKTDVDIAVTGPFARVRVAQRFRNPAVVCVDATYVFPLPENAAVDRLVVTYGDRKIEGVIREKAEAAAIYEQARSEGRRASLLDQSRPNVFKTSVANLLPQEEIVVELEYQQLVRFERDEYSLRFPTVVAHRYAPDQQTGKVASEEPTASAPVEGTGELNPVTIRVSIEAGVGLREIASKHHQIVATQLSPTRHTVALVEQSIPSDRDFELTWKPQLGAQAQATAFIEEVGGEHFAVITFLPPSSADSFARAPREAIFVIDTSGSMEGVSMEQAREALLFALDRLRPGDTFNVIEFDSGFTTLFNESRPATRDHIEEAKKFVSGLKSDGGTEMLAALEAALASDRANATVVRQVIFVTDGQVSNESQLFATISQKLGASRLFTVGIGSAPNSHFMSGAARFGRGTYTYIGEVSEVRQRMTELFDKLDSPALSDIELDFDTTADVAGIRDLYVGEPLVVTAKLEGRPSTLTLKGSTGSTAWTKTIDLTAAVSAPGVAKIWSREKIASIHDRAFLGETEENIRAAVLPIALKHGLVSKFTSFVAVDHSSPALSAGRCEALTVPVNAPFGGAQPLLDGSLPQTATPAGLYLILGAVLTALAVFLRASLS